MWKWLKRRLLGPIWRMELEARLEILEARCSDLAERFTRFQNRENMRQVRSEASKDRAIAEDALSILAGNETAPRAPTATAAPQPLSPEEEAAQRKLDLWRRSQH